MGLPLLTLSPDYLYSELSYLVAMSDFHIQIATTVPPIEYRSSPKGRTFRSDISTGHRRCKAFVKLLSIEDIARESLCAVLAKKLHLPILQPFYVAVDPSYLGEYRIANNQNVAFGLEQDTQFAPRIRGEQLENELLTWPEVLRCAAFDEWVGNKDRVPNNLLFAGYQHFWLIDHDECLPHFLPSGAPAQSGLIQLCARGKSEIQLYGLRRDLMSYVSDYKNINWEDVLELLRPDVIPGIERHYLDFFTFLKARSHQMFEIFTQSLSLRQREIDFSTPKDMNGMEKK